MKRFALLLLCAMLAVPAVPMTAGAAEDSTQVTDTKETTQETTEKTEGTDKSFDQLLTDAFVELYDYYVVLEINEKEKAEADKAMKTAAQQLGFDYTPADKAPKAGSFKANGKPVLQSESGITNCVATTKAKLDKITSDQPVEEKPVETPAANSNIIVGGKEYDTTIANAGQHCEIAVPLVNLGDTKVTNVVITPALSGDVTTWPFEISKTDYSQVCDVLEGENSGKNGKYKNT